MTPRIYNAAVVLIGILLIAIAGVHYFDYWVLFPIGAMLILVQPS